MRNGQPTSLLSRYVWLKYKCISNGRSIRRNVVYCAFEIDVVTPVCRSTIMSRNRYNSSVTRQWQRLQEGVSFWLIMPNKSFSNFGGITVPAYLDEGVPFICISITDRNYSVICYISYIWLCSWQFDKFPVKIQTHLHISLQLLQFMKRQ